MNVGTMVATAALLLVAWSPAQAQTSKDGQSLRDILNRAQSQSDRKAVEDLIGKLRSPSPAQPANPPAQPTAVSEPPTTPVSGPASTTADTAPAGMPSDVPVTAETPVPNSTTATPPATASAPPIATAPAADSTPTRPPEAPAGATTTATSIPQKTPEATSAPSADPVATVLQPTASPVSAPAIHPVGTPIGPAEALPTPIGPSEAEMARAPQIALEKGLPNVDIEVLFGYDSSQITPAAVESLLNLGRALNDPRLAGERFVIAGHTDARGSRAYNGALSHRRAQSVRQFLVEHFKITPDKLVARGFGETQLKNPRNPRSPENRRVQVINWTGQTAVENRR